MKTEKIEIHRARSLEHAMDQAIEAAESLCYRHGTGKGDLRLTKMLFKGLEVDISYRDNSWTYTFEAELEEL